MLVPEGGTETNHTRFLWDSETKLMLEMLDQEPVHLFWV